MVRVRPGQVQGEEGDKDGTQELPQRRQYQYTQAGVYNGNEDGHSTDVESNMVVQPNTTEQGDQSQRNHKRTPKNAWNRCINKEKQQIGSPNGNTKEEDDPSIRSGGQPFYYNQQDHSQPRSHNGYSQWSYKEPEEEINCIDYLAEEPIEIKAKFDELVLDFDVRQGPKQESRRVSVVSQYGIKEEKLLKIVLKKHLQNQLIRRIDAIHLIVDQTYPFIQIECTTNLGKHDNINLLGMIRGVPKDNTEEKNLKQLIRSVFYVNYSEIYPKSLKDFDEVFKYQTEMLHMDNQFHMKKNGFVESVLACYNLKSNACNFLVVDREWNEVHFNNLLFEQNPGKFRNAQQLFAKIRRGRGDSQAIDKDPNAAVLENQERDSDEDEIPIAPINLQDITSKIRALFRQGLAKFKDQIEAKEAEQSRLQSINENNDQELAKVMDEIFELNNTLQAYIESRNKLEKEFQKVSLDHDENRILGTYKHLRMLRNQLDSKLPIIARKRGLFEQLEKNSLIVLEGETGSGKSTQLPQLLCEFYNVFGNKKSKQILLTQPRKLATRTLAQRVAMELDEKVHGFVDYVSSSGKSPKKHSKIVFMLDRLLLDELDRDPLLTKYHCLVIDEAHERTLSIDILAGLIRNIVQKRPDFKVIVTSATLDAALFERYYSVKTFKVSGRMFPVEIVYKPCDNLTTNIDKIKKVLNDQILTDNNRQKYDGHILVFCTSVDEINTLCNEYSERPQIKALPLHGKLTTDEQRLIFEPEDRARKLIFTTRIAETAVTIDKVKIVVDLGIDRQTIYDQKKKITTFELKPISRSAAKQRAGRAGRTSPGFCFRLYSRDQQQKNMTANKVPEILSVPLDTLVLRLKQLKIKNIIQFEFIQKPNEQALKESQDRMQIFGCLNQYHEITQIGSLLVQIPIQPFMSRALAEGILIDRLKPRRKILPQLLKTLVMIVNGQSVFYSKYGDSEQQEKLQALKFNEFADKDGDFISLLKVYEAFENQPRHTVHKWCRDKFLNKKVLFQAAELYKEVKAIVDNAKINTQNCKEFVEEVLEKERTLKSNKDLILSCLLPSFCQELCLFSGDSRVGYTSIKRGTSLHIYGTSFLSLQGINPPWIVSYDVFKTSNNFCRFAHAVSFQILRKSIPARLFKRYKIQECQKSNPFYEVIPLSLNTVLFNDLKAKNYSGAKEMDFLKDATVLFQHQLNSVSIYANRNNALDTQKKVKDLLSQMSLDIKTNYSKYTHHYLGSLTSIMDSGCQPKALNFSTYLYAVKIMGIEYEIQSAIQFLYSKNVVKFQCTRYGLSVYFLKEESRKEFLIQLQLYKSYNKKEFSKATIKVQKGYEERSDKIPALKLRVKFFIGQPREKNNVLLIGYRSLRQAQTAKGYIQQYASQYAFRCKITGNGSKPNVSVIIHREHSHIDEVDFQEILEGLMANMNGWVKPPIVKGFRELDTQMCLMTTDQWKQKLKELIVNVQVDDINIKGYGPKGSNYYTDINAYIKMYDVKAAETFKQKYNKKKRVLGCESEKFHVSLTYHQLLVRVSFQIFRIFQTKYLQKKEQILILYPKIQIEEKLVNLKNGQFMYIEASGPKGHDLVRPGAIIREVFQAEKIPLNPLELKILNKKNGYSNGRTRYVRDSIFQEIEYYYNYNVYLQMLNKYTYAKVYAQKGFIAEAQVLLKDKIKEYNNMMIRISYKGKNVHEVIKVLQALKEKSGIIYQPMFSEKVMEVIGNIEVLAEVENEILRLVDQAKSECPICMSILLAPHRLFNCDHSFCKFCLVKTIRGAADDVSKYPLRCPQYQQCKTLINIYDLKSLFDQQQFDQMCDRGVQSMVENNLSYHGCKTTDCGMIFQAKKSEQDGMYQCTLCGMSYCFKCKEAAHSGMDCDQSKNPKRTIQQQRSQGIMRCGSCNTPIFKTGGCNHMSCRCGSHFCWVCTKAFSTATQCCNHLAKDCGGIFDRNFNQQQDERFMAQNQGIRPGQNVIGRNNGINRVRRIRPF